VTRVRNAGQFQIQCRAAHRDYENRYGPLIAEVRAKYSNNPIEQVIPAVEELLEAHGRAYLINALLNALNWRLNCTPEQGLPNLVPEAPVTSIHRGTTRFLDYLGLERDTLKPLLIVEAKRPGSLLPQRKMPVPKDAKYANLVDEVPYVVCDGLEGVELVGEWNEWLDTLRDYVCSAKNETDHTPQRVVITNGDWLILFADPDNAFLPHAAPDPARILVWRDHMDIENRCEQLFKWLEHSAVLRQTASVAVGELPFYTTPDVVDGAIYGLWLLYTEVRGFYGRSPHIQVKPVLYLHSQHGAWLCVERRTESSAHWQPHSYRDLPGHLEEVKQSAESLLQAINKVRHTELSAIPLTRYYLDEEAFVELRGVVETGYRSKDQTTEYRVIIGDNTHYLLPNPSVSDCPYHDWHNCQNDGVESNPGPVQQSSTRNPRAFFVSGEHHHCAHCDVSTAKSSQITNENRNRCGLRSGAVGQAFCEIARFEEYLCCRACAFQEVCAKAEVFHLPC
jgi:hypothetical protein